eukprot:359332-Chlamydomonas_euryale.AAC.2
MADPGDAHMAEPWGCPWLRRAADTPPRAVMRPRQTSAFLLAQWSIARATPAPPCQAISLLVQRSNHGYLGICQRQTAIP